MLVEELTGPAAQVQCGICGEQHDYEGFESSEGEVAQDNIWEVGQSQYDKHSQRINRDTPLRGRRDGDDLGTPEWEKMEVEVGDREDIQGHNLWKTLDDDDE